MSFQQLPNELKFQIGALLDLKSLINFPGINREYKERLLASRAEKEFKFLKVKNWYKFYSILDKCVDKLISKYAYKFIKKGYLNSDLMYKNLCEIIIGYIDGLYFELAANLEEELDESLWDDIQYIQEEVSGLNAEFRFTIEQERYYLELYNNIRDTVYQCIKNMLDNNIISP